MDNKNKKILVTAGPTIEPLDPVRFISNYSTGTVGYEIAAEGVKNGYEVCLVTGPVNLLPPEGAEVIKITTAEEMASSVFEKIQESDCIIMTAAVCDFRPKEVSKSKIKKKDILNLELIKNPDILLKIRGKKNLFKVGFALETDDAIANGRKKLEEKELDLIVVNKIDGKNKPFGPDTAGGKRKTYNYVLLASSGERRELNGITKKELAEHLMKEVGKAI